MPGNRTLRYSSIMSAEALERTHPLIVGCGAIGRQVALRLAQMGVTTMTIVDMDTVSEENLGPQGFSPTDVGRPKVQAIAAHIGMHIAAECRVTQHNGRVEEMPLEGDLPFTHLFVCVDDMDVRGWIYANVYSKCPANCHYFDARMGAETLHIYNIPGVHINPEDASGQTLIALESLQPRIDDYRSPNVLFPQSEAEEAPCTERATSYCADMAGALLCLFFSYTLREGMVPPYHTVFNMTALELWNEEPPRARTST